MATKVTVVETMRSLLYLPYYLALARGTCQRMGLEVDNRLSPDAVTAPRMIVDGDADIYIGGPARVMMNYHADDNCPLICFGLIATRNPFVLIGAQDNPGFKLSDLRSMRVGVAIEAPTPWLMLQQALRHAGIAPEEISLAPRVSMAENINRLRDGAVDVIQTMEPFTDAASEGTGGHIWYKGSTQGEIGFSSLVTTEKCADEKADMCSAILTGLAESQRSLCALPPAQIAREIAPFFPQVGSARLVRAITRYRENGIWACHPWFSQEAYRSMGDIMVRGGKFPRFPPHEQVVRNVFLPKKTSIFGQVR